MSAFDNFNAEFAKKAVKPIKKAVSLVDSTNWIEDVKSKNKERVELAIDAHMSMSDAGFGNWAYVTSADKMVNINNGEVISKSAFTELLGHLELPLRIAYKKDEEKKVIPFIKMASTAIQAFTSNKFFMWTKAYGVCIDSDVPHGDMVDIEGRQHVNLWSGTQISASSHGGKYFDMFVDLINRLMDEDDAKVVTQWLAHKIQNPTKKCNWSPILVGTKGNGKTTIGQVISNILGSRYSRVINKESLKEKYNGWIENTCFVIVEEIKIGADFDVINRLKEYVANSNVSMRKMQTDSSTIRNHADFIFCSNFMDAIKLENDERRWYPVLTKQKNADDVEASFGANGGARYFNDFYSEVVNSKKGLEDICYHLSQVDISEFNKGRAPESVHKSEFLEASLSNDAFEIREVINLIGLETNGMIFTQDLTKHLNNAGVKVSSRRYGQAMAELGYVKKEQRVRIGQLNGYIYYHTKRYEGTDPVSEYKRLGF